MKKSVNSKEIREIGLQLDKMHQMIIKDPDKYFLSSKYPLNFSINHFNVERKKKDCGAFLVFGGDETKEDEDLWLFSMCPGYIDLLLNNLKRHCAKDIKKMANKFVDVYLKNALRNAYFKCKFDIINHASSNILIDAFDAAMVEYIKSIDYNMCIYKLMSKFNLTLDSIPVRYYYDDDRNNDVFYNLRTLLNLSKSSPINKHLNYNMMMQYLIYLVLRYTCITMFNDIMLGINKPSFYTKSIMTDIQTFYTRNARNYSDILVDCDKNDFLPNLKNNYNVVTSVYSKLTYTFEYFENMFTDTKDKDVISNIIDNISAVQFGPILFVANRLKNAHFHNTDSDDSRIKLYEQLDGLPTLCKEYSSLLNDFYTLCKDYNKSDKLSENTTLVLPDLFTNEYAFIEDEKDDMDTNTKVAISKFKKRLDKFIENRNVFKKSLNEEISAITTLITQVKREYETEISYDSVVQTISDLRTDSLCDNPKSVTAPGLLSPNTLYHM